MDGFAEKKWFVYLGDHHEGPFSVAEIQGKLAQGQVSAQSYVWAEGMSDWKLMGEVTAFESVSSPTKGSGGGAEVAGPILNVVASDSPTVLTELVPATPAQDEPSVPILLVPTSEEPVAQEAPIEEKPIPAAEAALAISEATRMTTSQEGVPMTAIEGKTGDKEAGTATELLKKQAAQGAKRPFPRRLFSLLVLVSLGAGAYYADQQGMLKPARALIADPALQSTLQGVLQSTVELARPLLYEVLDRVPLVGEWISPIPTIAGVSPAEAVGLKKAALSPKGEAGAIPAGADFAVGRADPMAPVFYVAANAPDGTPLEVRVEGISDTLLNQLSFQARLPVTLQKRFGQTLPLKQADQRLIPRGEYLVTLAIPGASPSNAPLATRTVFLGGARDATYTSRLKEYHDRMRDKARQELSELRQYHATLDAQLASTADAFAKLRKQRKAWPRFHDQWTKMQSQLEIVFSQWTPERLAGEFFYSRLYALTQQAAQATSQVHGLHQSFFVGGADSKSFDIQLGESMGGARAALLQLKTKLEQAERLPPTPNGMPRRDSL